MCGSANTTFSNRTANARCKSTMNNGPVVNFRSQRPAQGTNMFELEQSIAEWRQQMTEGVDNTPLPLDQLENHLREEIGNLMSAGMPEAQAFQLAVSRLGSPGPLQTEFTNAMLTSCGPVTIGSLLLGGMIIVLAVGLLPGDLLASQAETSFCLAHIFQPDCRLRCAAFLAGCFGVYYVCYRSFQPLSPECRHSLRQAVFLFNKIAAGLVIAGMLLGMLWSKQHLGRYLGGGGPRETPGILCARPPGFSPCC